MISMLIIYIIYQSMTDPTSKQRNKVVYDQEEESDDLDQLQEDNSFQDGNKIYELKSEIHSLQIQKNKLSLQHQAALASSQAKNQQLNQQINALKRDNTKLLGSIRKLELQNEDLRKINEGYKNQAEGMNRRTADFHRSIQDNNPLGDPSQLINELLSKDKKIEELTKKIQSLELRPNSNVSNNSNKLQDNEKQKYEQQIKGLKNSVDELKKKQIAYKREYENMIQAKQEIIKKMSTQNDQFSRKIAESKDKVINQLRKQHQQQEKKLETARTQNAVLNDKLSNYDKQLNRLKAEYKRKQQSLISHYEGQKQQISKGLNDKLKRHIKDKQQKLNKNDERILELENQVMIYKQQIGKQKAEVVSLNQYNTYLETSNKQYEENKKKLQQTIYEKEKQIGEIRQASFTEVSELKKAIMSERSQFQHKISTLQQQLLEKKLFVEKLEQQIYQIERKQSDGARQLQGNFQKQMERFVREKQELGRDLQALQERYREKSDKMNNLEKKIKKQYEERILGLETELVKEREKVKEKEQRLSGVSERVEVKQGQLEQLQKYKNISELRRLQVEEKQQQIKKLVEEKNRNEKQNNRIKEQSVGLEKKLKQKIEDYKNLEVSFEQLSQKYRKGVKQLQIKIQQTQQQILQQRKRAERRKNEAAENQKNMSVQLKQYKTKVKQLEQELSEYKNKKVEDAQHTDLKLQKLAHEISMINKQKQSAIKTQERKIREKEDVLLEQKNKLLEYIEQLEENNNILNKKIAMLENKDKKNSNVLEKELRDLKVQYSQSLKEVNIVLQKYKKLEEVHRETLAGIQNLKQEKQSLNKKYVEIHREKNKIFDELNSAYDQINKLNIVLMSKQQQLSRSKVVNCPHYESKSRVIYAPTVQGLNETPGFGTLNPSRSKSPHKFYDRSESYYISPQNPPQNRYSRYN